MEQNLILVNEHDQQTGVQGKVSVHKEGKLHRAFSILIFNNKGEILLQKRAHQKYHSGGLWTNACCSHPLPMEPIETTLQRRLMEEMGFTCQLKFLFSFIYKVQLGNGLYEHEFDHVYGGKFNGVPIPNPSEVASYKWISIPNLLVDMQNYPEKYTVWFHIIINKHIDFLNDMV